MMYKIFTVVAFATTLLTTASAVGISVTPHQQYSSSVGVLGCKIDPNRVAFWPSPIDCNKICVKVTEPGSGRSVTLLKIDQTRGAYDISYDAWNYLLVGQSAAENPQTGGGLAVDYEDVPGDECLPNLRDANGRLALTAASSVDFAVGCPPGSWVGDNLELVNIYEPVCLHGHDEVCTLDLDVSNQPACAHTLGSMDPLGGHAVMVPEYGTGKMVQCK